MNDNEATIPQQIAHLDQLALPGKKLHGRSITAMKLQKLVYYAQAWSLVWDVWCIRHLNVMRILWWDPDHLVCPSVMKHT
jgi:uncharacterized phage-associated protein